MVGWIITLMEVTQYANIKTGCNETEIMGFEPQVNQRLLPPTFPRYTQIRSRVEAITYLIQLMDRIKTMCKVKDHTNFHSALVSIIFLLYYFE